MSRVPSVGMEKAYEEITTTDQNRVTFYMAHTLEYSFDPNSNVEEIHYLHYGTPIVYIFHDKTNDRYKIILSNHGWSQSDAMNVTGLLYCMGIYTVKCYRHYEELFLKYRGNKTGLKELTIE